MIISHHSQIVQGINVHYVHAGEGTPLLLIHGYLVSHRSWLKVIGQLAPHFSIYAIDLPGFGDSAQPREYDYTVEAFAQTISSFLDALQIKKLSVVGHSLGAAITLSLVVQRPELIHRLVLADPVIYPIQLPLEGRLALLPGIGSFLFKKLYRKKDMRRYFSREVYLNPNSLVEETLSIYWDTFNRPGGREASYGTLQGLSNLFRLRYLPPQVCRPALIIWGDHDRIVPRLHVEALANSLPQASLNSIEQCGHAPQEEQPEMFCNNLIPFLRDP